MANLEGELYRGGRHVGSVTGNVVETPRATGGMRRDIAALVRLPGGARATPGNAPLGDDLEVEAEGFGRFAVVVVQEPKLREDGSGWDVTLCSVIGPKADTGEADDAGKDAPGR